MRWNFLGKQNAQWETGNGGWGAKTSKGTRPPLSQMGKGNDWPPCVSWLEVLCSSGKNKTVNFAACICTSDGWPRRWGLDVAGGLDHAPSPCHRRWLDWSETAKRWGKLPRMRNGLSRGLRAARGVWSWARGEEVEGDETGVSSHAVQKFSAEAPTCHGRR